MAPPWSLLDSDCWLISPAQPLHRAPGLSSISPPDIQWRADPWLGGRPTAAGPVAAGRLGPDKAGRGPPQPQNWSAAIPVAEPGWSTRRSRQTRRARGRVLLL